ncbi:T9SS type A sorting domain-containing protein [candidate division KSB1 bacterium]|nr:T9SS type A sorting domain-containing protein [candidate division KSB1 bacterium]
MKRSGIFFISLLSMALIGSLAMAQTHFTFTANTGNNATVVIPTAANPNIDGTALVTGDEIGAFTPGGLCVGAVVWTEGANAALTVWGDDDQTTEVDGIKAGEAIMYRLWQMSSDVESEDATVTYAQGDGNYVANAMFVLATLDAAAPEEGMSIKKIQFTEDPSGDSPLLGQVVTVSGIVSAEHRGSNYNNGGISGSYFFMMDKAAAWSGIQVLYSGNTTAEGDCVTVTGTVGEYYGQTQIKDVTEFILHSTRNPVPGPVVVTTAEANSEPYEDCLVQVQDVTIVETDIGDYANWRVDDGSGAVKIDTRAKYYYTPVLNDPVKSLTGIVLYGYNEYSVAPRLAWDIVEGGEFTRIQRIQQVRNSDLVLAYQDEYSDSSYASGDTIKVRGIVTMPTGLSYAGDGIKFIVSEMDGGPWSGILSYHPDSTAYPTLYEGDVIEVEGYIDEYRTIVSNMTEFWITSEIEITDIGQPLPAIDTLNTGDLRLPVDAEQWGNVFVAIKNAKVVETDINPQDGVFAVDDGSGSLIVDNDSDSLYYYYLDNPKPPLGANLESARGWVYHHFGSYADCTTYKLAPLYLTDMIWGGGAPPAITSVHRDIAVPGSTDDVTVTAEITTELSIVEAALYYDVVSGGTSAGYVKVVMTNTSGDLYEATIPAQSAGTVVNYYVIATDDLGQTSCLPIDINRKNFWYKVSNVSTLTIKDIQYTPWEIADSPMEGQHVAVTGIVTADTGANRVYRAYAIQDAMQPWSGIFAWNIKTELYRGAEVTVFGTVTDYNPDYPSKWNNNTLIMVDSVIVGSSGNVIEPLIVKTGRLVETTQEAESYEGVLVRIQNATLTHMDRYDVTFDDGSGPCRVDADFLVARDHYENDIVYINQDGGYMVAWGDTIRPGNRIDYIQGIFTHSFGTMKIELRDEADFGVNVGVDPDFKAALVTYSLEQNYPNPFNPETHIHYSLPEMQNVKLIVYNMLGQKIRTLVNTSVQAGHHSVVWDGMDESGNVVPTGIYIYRMRAGDFLESRKMLMIK